ncbi:hypothetical protein SBBP1_310010 [Burkholderiales bacterium]|nr:hypothetical protein SBBP1_310010 [Burkholderiales bacterium]
MSWTSIWAKAFLTWLRRPTRALYATIAQTTIATTKPNRTYPTIFGSLAKYRHRFDFRPAAAATARRRAPAFGALPYYELVPARAAAAFADRALAQHGGLGHGRFADRQIDQRRAQRQ